MGKDHVRIEDYMKLLLVLSLLVFSQCTFNAFLKGDTGVEIGVDIPTTAIPDPRNDDEKKCYEKCEKKFDKDTEDVWITSCKTMCYYSEGKCKDSSNSKCKDAATSTNVEIPDIPEIEIPEIPGVAARRRNDAVSDAKKNYEKICDIVCPKSIWWVFLIVGLVVVIAVVVILVLVCFFKKLLCFGASKASVAPSETVTVETGSEQ